MCSCWTMRATMAFAVCCSVRVGSRWSRQLLSGSMRQTLVVWSISQLPFLAPSSQYTLLALILNFLRHSRSSMSSSLAAVTPMMFLPNSARQSFMTFAVSLAGSTETKTSFNFMQAPSGKFLMMRYTEERQQRELGQISGQLLYPKQMRQQLPFRFLLENGWPYVLMRVQSPPINDSFNFSYLRPEISSSMTSRFSLPFWLAEQKRYMSPPTRIAMPMAPIFVTPSYVLPYIQSSTGALFRFFCYCIIQASCLLRGMLSFSYAKHDRSRRWVKGRGRRRCNWECCVTLVNGSVEVRIFLIILILNVTGNIIIQREFH